MAHNLNEYTRYRWLLGAESTSGNVTELIDQMKTVTQRKESSTVSTLEFGTLERSQYGSVWRQCYNDKRARAGRVYGVNMKEQYVELSDLLGCKRTTRNGSEGKEVCKDQGWAWGILDQIKEFWRVRHCHRAEGGGTDKQRKIRIV